MTNGERPFIYTIGHSTRSIVQFVTLLQAGRVELVVDIRSIRDRALIRSSTSTRSRKHSPTGR